MTSSRVALKPGSIWINGQPVILVTSSLFYFRIPAAEWRSRMRTLRILGYNAIDVYFPWNYHELEPNHWDFSGERDVRTFLQQAKDEGIWVVARPGPYICSEWDGGSLPAWLNIDPDVRLRDNDPRYLDAVRGWFDQIVPFVAEYQVDRGGTVVLVQIENELDFYNCTDRVGLMSALRDLVLARGIIVPLLACAGQGDIPGATGNIANVAPACNLYFDPHDPGIEQRVRHYDHLVRQRGYPLCVIETNRSHTDLRRLMVGGAKLLGPYLQTGGTDFGFTTGVTNWGDPLSFMTSHYDFGGMVSPGGKVCPEGREAIILTKMLAALGPAMALSAPQSCPPIPVQGVEGQALALDGGGWLVGLPNTGEKAVQVTLGKTAEHFPVKTGLKVAPNTCPFVLLDYPLSRWGMDCRITYSTGELVGCMARDDALEFTFAVDTAVELMVDWPDSILGNCQSWQTEKSQTGWRLWMDSTTPADVELIGEEGKRLIVKAVDRAEIGNLEKAGLDETQIVSTQAASNELDLLHVNCRLAPVDPCSLEWFTSAHPCKPDKLHLEENDIFRGFGWYRTVYHPMDNVQGFLIRSGSDVLSLYLDAKFMGTFVPCGGDMYVPLPDGIGPSAESELVVRAEIWGHANFDDHRLPALRLKSMRGMDGVVAIRGNENITSNWFYQHRAKVPAPQIDSVWPYINFGGWSATEEPLRGVYYREVSFANGMDARVLHFPGLQVNAQVFLNGQPAGMVNPFNPCVDLSDLSQPGETAVIAVAVEQDFRRSAGQVLLYQGESLQEWELAGWDEFGLAGLANESALAAKDVNFPVTFAGGEMAWLHIDLPLSVDWSRGWDLQLEGHGLKASTWIGKRLVGRIWLPSEMRPRMTGGADDRMVLPASWLEEADGQLHLLLEGVSPVGELSRLKFVLGI